MNALGNADAGAGETVRVALIIDSLDLGGAERVVEQIALGRAGRGRQTFVYLLKTGGAAAQRLRASGVIVREADSRGPDPLLPLRLRNWMARDTIHLVHAHSSAALVLAFAGAKLRGVPIVQTRHGALLGRASRYRRIAQRLASDIDRIVLVSPTLIAAVPAGSARRRAVVVRNGIDRPRLARGESRTLLERACGRSPAGPAILSVGTICAEKDTRGLIRAFALLKRQCSDTELICAGGTRDAAYHHAVRADIRQLGLEQCVTLLGPVPDAYRLMAGADVFCQASRTEALPIALLEAMSQGVPIVATAVGDVACLPPHPPQPDCLLQDEVNGLVVPPASPGALAQALHAAIADRAAAERRAAAATRDYAARFTARQMVRRYESLYSECCTHRGAAASRSGHQSRRPRVLMVGPAAPRIGGMVRAIDTLMTSRLRQKYVLHRFATTFDAGARPGECSTPRAGEAWRLLGAGRRHGRAWFDLLRTIGHEAIDLVHIHTCSYATFWRNLLDIAAVRLLRRRYVLHIRGGRFEEFCRSCGPFGKWLIRNAAEAAETVIVLSDSWQERLAPYFGRARVVVVPNGVRLSSMKCLPERRQATAHAKIPQGTGRLAGCRFLFLGPLTAAKGLGDLLEAAERMERREVAYQLLIVGAAKDDLRKQWQREARARRIEHRVEFRSEVGPEQTPALFNSVDCLVHPSRSEGLPFTILEAAAAGLPVVATDVGAVGEIFRDQSGIPDTASALPQALVPPRNPQALADALERVAKDTDGRERLGRTLLARVASNYGLDRMIDAIDQLYAEALRRGGGLAARTCVAKFVHAADATVQNTAVPPTVAGTAAPRGVLAGAGAP